MSKTLFTFLIGDLELVRIICKKCRSALEVEIRKINNRSDLRCPCCHGVIFRDGDSHSTSDAYVGLAQAFERLKAEQLADIEFVIPVKEMFSSRDVSGSSVA